MNPLSHPSSMCRPERGTALVETALSIVPFMLLIFATFEAGRFLDIRHTLTNAAREGARYAVAPASMTAQLPSEADIESRVRMFLDAGRIRDATVTIQRPVNIDTGILQQSFTRVRVECQYQVLTVPFFSALEVPLTGEALMRNETSP